MAWCSFKHTCVCISNAQGLDVSDRKWALSISSEACTQLALSVAAESVNQTSGGHECQGVVPVKYTPKYAVKYPISYLS